MWPRSASPRSSFPVSVPATRQSARLQFACRSVVAGRSNERTNSWLSNYGQLRRNTDRNTAHRSAQLAFVIAILLIAKLLDRGYLSRS